jgi:hypothetical protein
MPAATKSSKVTNRERNWEAIIGPEIESLREYIGPDGGDFRKITRLAGAATGLAIAPQPP